MPKKKDEVIGTPEYVPEDPDNLPTPEPEQPDDPAAPRYQPLKEK